MKNHSLLNPIQFWCNSCINSWILRPSTADTPRDNPDQLVLTISSPCRRHQWSTAISLTTITTSTRHASTHLLICHTQIFAKNVPLSCEYLLNSLPAVIIWQDVHLHLSQLTSQLHLTFWCYSPASHYCSLAFKIVIWVLW